ncbi:MAG: VWA domain-containing protein [Acidobacteria bacterium]|nr:VWA domain-containing protein [Acidobacteriota bacterium]
MKLVTKNVCISVKIICLVMTLAAYITPIYAQQGTSSSSVSRTRDNANNSANSRVPKVNSSSELKNSSPYPSNNANNYNYAPTILRSSEIRVEEFVNYHKHQLPLPKSGEMVALDVRWGNEQISSTSKAVLQIGFRTPSVNDRQDLPPANLAIVIDRSGSMKSDYKLEKVKTALLVFVKQLKEQDILSLIVYDSSAQVIWPATHMTSSSKHRLSNIISSIYTGSNTNLHGGLILGYKEVLKNFREKATNRVILLTDGIANEGVTNPEEIVADSRSFNNRGIDLSTIGVGRDLNESLLSRLAKSGRGLYHFVADSDDINKVFVKEAESLVALVAKRVRVDIEYDKALQLDKVYGYKPNYRENGASITLDNMNYGLTQVIMMEFTLDSKVPLSLKSAAVKVELFYETSDSDDTVVKSERTFIKLTEKHNLNPLVDNEVKKNFTIASLAQAIKDMAAFYERGYYSESSNVVKVAIKEAYSLYPSMNDRDITYILNILKDYNRRLINDSDVETFGEEE